MEARQKRSDNVAQESSSHIGGSSRTASGKFVPSEKKWIETVLKAYKEGRKSLEECMIALENFIIEAEDRATKEIREGQVSDGK